jgi:hypothetical protein
MTRWNEIDLDNVPTIDDFTIELRELEDCGRIVHFTSAVDGELAWFPAWEHADRDLRHFVASDVPIGTLDNPYDDRDEGWRIIIFEHAGHVYVFEDDRPNGTRFPRRYRIPRVRYFMAWASLLHEFNPLVGLDDLPVAGGEPN